ncbi:unnamed protein product [Diabrotica balteata]|uniref:Major facilitator superfamily associated domain-containing protein n=1 Tax=Diabrotica balteata TaxID=107213 RepID=A0A9N9X633_DIABA|nr:unnamed protein product [Diabrotica balteata]
MDILFNLLISRLLTYFFHGKCPNMAQRMKTFFDCVIKDFNQNELLPTKMLFFIHSLSTLILYPFLVVQMKHLGLDVQETAIISFVTPFVSIILPLFIGRIADKIGHVKYLLAVSSVAAGPTALLLLLVPVARTTVMFPENLIFSVSCEGESIPYLSLHGEDMCILHENKKTLDSLFHQQSCGFGCQAYLDQTYTDYVMNVSRYQVLLYDVIYSKPMVYTFPVIPENESELRMETQRKILLKNNHRYSNTIMKMSKNSFYFPTMHMFNFTCNMTNEPNIGCVMGGNEQFVDFKRLEKFWNARLKLLPPDNYDIEENTQTFEFDYLNSTKQNNITCKRNEVMNTKLISVSINVDLPHSPIKHLDIGSCSLRCLVTTRRENVCINPVLKVEQNVALSFWSYLGIRVVLDIINSASIIMFETVLREKNDDYGFQKVYVIIGGMICSPFSGWMIDYASGGKNYHDFRASFRRRRTEDEIEIDGSPQTRVLSVEELLEEYRRMHNPIDNTDGEVTDEEDEAVFLERSLPPIQEENMDEQGASAEDPNQKQVSVPSDYFVDSHDPMPAIQKENFEQPQDGQLVLPKAPNHIAVNMPADASDGPQTTIQDQAISNNLNLSKNPGDIQLDIPCDGSDANAPKLEPNGMGEALPGPLDLHNNPDQIQVNPVLPDEVDAAVPTVEENVEQEAVPAPNMIAAADAPAAAVNPSNWFENITCTLCFFRLLTLLFSGAVMLAVWLIGSNHK